MHMRRHRPSARSSRERGRLALRDNHGSKPPTATRAWLALRAKAIVEDDELTFDWPLVFDVTKDKPVLFTALASANVLPTRTAATFIHFSARPSMDSGSRLPANFSAPSAIPDSCPAGALGRGRLLPTNHTVIVPPETITRLLGYIDLLPAMDTQPKFIDLGTKYSPSSLQFMQPIVLDPGEAIHGDVNKLC